LSDSTEKIYPSPPSEPDDEFWLAEGKRMVTESLYSVRNAASALIAALGILQGVYLAVLGFGEKQLNGLSFLQQAQFIAPVLLWLVSFYLCLAVVMTKKLAVFTNSPSDVRDKSIRLLLKKQLQLQWAFWLLALGLLATFGLLFSRLQG
jgi:hypothetical protein